MQQHAVAAALTLSEMEAGCGLLQAAACWCFTSYLLADVHVRCNGTQYIYELDSASSLDTSCSFFLKRAGELRIIKLREENSTKWTKVQCQNRQNTKHELF
jgi:hypothetical protein